MDGLRANQITTLSVTPIYTFHFVTNGTEEEEEEEEKKNRSLYDTCRTVARMTQTAARLLRCGSINISWNSYVTKPTKSIEHPKYKLYTIINTVHTSQAL